MPESDYLLKEYALRDGDLLFTRYNGSIELLGVCGMVRGLGGERRLYPDKLMRVCFDHSHIMPEYAEVFFGGVGARDRITAKAKSSAGQQGVSGVDIKNQPFALPPLAEQEEIVRRVETLFKLTDTIEKRMAIGTRMAEGLTQAILAKAFRGELVPTEAELARIEGRSYEPASELLARVKDLCNSSTSRLFRRRRATPTAPTEMRTQVSKVQRALITEIANGAMVISGTSRSNGQILMERRGSKFRVIRWSTFNCLIKKRLVRAETSAIATIWRLTEHGNTLAAKTNEQAE